MTEPTNAELAKELKEWAALHEGTWAGKRVALAAQRLSEPVEVRVNDHQWGTDLKGCVIVFEEKGSEIDDALEAGRPVLLIPGDA